MNPLTFVSAFWMAGLLAPTASPVATTLAPQAARVVLAAHGTQKLEFDWDGLHADGTPNAMADKIIFHFQAVGAGQPTVIAIDQLVTTGLNQVFVSTVVKALPDGDYDASVAVMSPEGNKSDFSPVLAVTVRGKKPSAPKNFGVSG